MASQTEKHKLAQAAGSQNAHIDFYKQTDQHQITDSQNPKNDFKVSGGTAFGDTQDYQQDPSPIHFSNHTKGLTQNDNFMDMHFQDKSEESKRLQVERHDKRKSIESKDAILKNKSKDILASHDVQHQGNNRLNGAKSALMQQNNGSSNQPMKQINKNAKVERDPTMEMNQQQLYQQQQKRNLAKSQSQNRLLLVSPDTLLQKNNPYQDTYNNQETGGNANAQDKNSFFKDQLNPIRNGNQQELLYKQHMQYSSNGLGGSHHLKGWQLKASNHNLFLSRMTTKSECTFCNKTSAGGTHSHSVIPHHCSAFYCSKDQQGMMIQNQLSKKYSTNRDYYNLKIVNDLIYNENTHIVSIFKDYLILDDINEFLKRTYTVQETKVRLPKLCSFYDKYSQVFPNYVCLPESKYMFKNIQRKQKLIDEQYQLQEELSKKQHITLQDEDKLFNTKFYNSYYSNMGDISMTKKQYEEQAKQIATQAGKKLPVRGLGINEMCFDELVDRFLLKDSESNIQMITTTGLDFSGFTHQNSTFITGQFDRTPGKQPTPTIVKTQGKTQTRPVKKVSEEKKKPMQQTNVVLSQSKQPAWKKQKTSFNNSGKSGSQGIKVESIKNGASEQSKTTTPRLQKASNQPNQLEINSQNNKKQQIQTSPQTKEAIKSYLQSCHLDAQDRQPQTAQASQHTQSLGPLLSPSSNGYLESPALKSPNLLTSKPQTNSQTSLHPQTTHNRQNLKSQCAIPTISLATQQINAKKNTRLSNGGKTVNLHRKNVSPGTQQQQTSRNQNMVSNSTQKSVKSVNSHAKYLSGGNEQYQKMLVNINNQHTQQNNIDTMNSHLINSSGKKPNLLHQQRSKQDLNLETFIGTQHSHQKQHPDQIDNEVLTGEDCDDFGIADERFASPEAHLVFSTADDNTHKSRDSTGPGPNPQQMLLLTSTEDKVMQQCNNFDQIKKHLEQYINNSGQQTFDSGEGKIANNKSNEKVQSSSQTGYNRDHMTQSVNSQLHQSSQDHNTSRNGTTQKHFESLKHKIRGVYDYQQHTDPPSVQSANKTPNKSITSKKSQHTLQPSNNALLLQQNRMSLESNLMNIPGSNSHQMTSTQANRQPLSFSQQQQTSFAQNAANYRSITNLQQRKASNHKMESSIETKRMSGQQNKQSFKEASVHNQQAGYIDKHRGMKKSATGKTLKIQDNNAQSHTFGQNQTGYLQSVSSTATLCNPTFIGSNQSSSKHYSTTHQAQNSLSAAQQHILQQQQAANTVRVMTPSYSLASLSKLISPTTSTASPMTMTVNLTNGQNIGRKQVAASKSRGTALHPPSHHQYNPTSSLVPSHSQNFLLADKGSKLIGSKVMIQSKAHLKPSTKTNHTVQQPNIPTTLSQKLGRQPVLQQSTSQQTLQITPRGQQPTHQEATRKAQPIQTNQFENSGNLSCTVSTENNSTAKAIESKHPKFMRTIEEYSNQTGPQYNTMLSATMNHRKSGVGLATSVSQAQFDVKHQKQKIQTVVNSNQPTIKRTSNVHGQMLSSSASVCNFKSPSQQIQMKKKGSYLNN